MADNSWKKTSIYLSDVLMPLKEETRHTGEGLSNILGRYVRRFNIMCDVTTLPSLTSAELDVLRDTLKENFFDKQPVTAELLMAMEWSISRASGEEEAKKSLADKVKELRPAERMVLIDAVEHDKIKVK